MPETRLLRLGWLLAKGLSLAISSMCLTTLHPHSPGHPAGLTLASSVVSRSLMSLSRVQFIHSEKEREREQSEGTV